MQSFLTSKSIHFGHLYAFVAKCVVQQLIDIDKRESYLIPIYFQSLNINVIPNSKTNDIFIQGDSFFDEKNKRCPILNDILLSYAMTRQFNLQ